MAPAATDRMIVRRIADETAPAVRDAAIAALLRANGMDVLGGGPEDFAAMIAAHTRLWADAVALAGVARQ